MAEWHIHPISGKRVYGDKLPFDSAIRNDDLYDSTDGQWRKAGPSLSGLTLRWGCETYWVRPLSPIATAL